MKLFRFIILLTGFISFAQIKNGKVEYSVIIEMIEGFKGTKMEDIYTESINNARYLSFTLTFNRENAVFSLNEGLSVDNNDIFLAKVAAGYLSDVYQNKDFSLSLIPKMYGDYVLKTEAVKDWQLINETKEIEGFLCYKATSTKIVANSKGTFRFPIIAWYCPKIPLSFGPNGYGNLPGLILELQVRNVIYGVKKIDLNLQSQPLLGKINDYTIISQEEFNTMVKNVNINDTYKGMFKKPDEKL